MPKQVSPSSLVQSLPILANKSVLSTSIVDSQEDFDLWHFRLGHPSDSRLFLTDLKTKHFKKPCPIYTLAKMHRLPFNVSQHKSENCFDLLHCDCGDLVLTLPMMDQDISLPLLMITANALGFIC